MKCEKCGKNISLFNPGVTLRDGLGVCYKCVQDLDFDKGAVSSLSWDEIKDGRKKYVIRKFLEEAKKNPPIQFAHYGEKREVNPTVEEVDLFGQILSALHESGRDTSLVELVRKSDNYVTAQLYETDICRFKFTDRAQWIELPYSETGHKKIRIDRVQDVRQYDEELGKHYDLAVKVHSQV